jgi:hypothetical protein
MKTWWKVAGIAAVVVLVGVVALGAVAFAQDDDGDARPFDFRQRLHEAIAGVLGISVEAYDAAVDTAQEQVIGEAVAEGWLTEEQAARMQERWAEGGRGSFGRGRVGHGPMAPGFGAGASFLEVAAEQLGMEVDGLLAALRDGKSLADVAGERGVDPETIVDAYLAEVSERLDKAVAEGRITEAQADDMLAEMETRLREHLEEAYPFNDCGPGMFPGGGKHRGPGRFPGAPAAPRQDA